MKKIFGKDVLVLVIALVALIIAAVALNSSLNQLVNRE